MAHGSTLKYVQSEVEMTDDLVDVTDRANSSSIHLHAKEDYMETLHVINLVYEYKVNNETFCNVDEKQKFEHCQIINRYCLSSCNESTIKCSSRSE